MTICEIGDNLKQEMQNADKNYRECLPSATKQLDEKTPKGWKIDSEFKNLKLQQQEVLQKYNNHKKDCVVCKI
ncbi:hypothetical protein HN532_04100 [archaeon]|jgi:hypothetical protein|nr:hypothetical protein [archaeon]